MSEEEEIPVEEVSEEKGEVVEEEGEEVLRGFTIEGLELMLARVEEIEKIIKGLPPPSGTELKEKTPKKEKSQEEVKPRRSKKSKRKTSKTSNTS